MLRPDDKAKKMERDVFFLHLLLCVSTCMLPIAVGCKTRSEPVARTETTMTAAVDSIDLDALRRRTGLTFPAQAKVLGHDSERGLDDAVSIKVEIHSTELEGFLKQSVFSNEAFVEAKRFLLGKNRGPFWDPEAPSLLPTAQVQLPDSSVLNVGYDGSRSDVAILYVFWHET